MKHFRVCDSDKVHVINAYIQGVFFNLVILIVRRFRGRGSVEGFEFLYQNHKVMFDWVKNYKLS